MLVYGVTMTLPRRAQMTLSVFWAIVLGGMLGLLWWWRHHRPGCQPAARLPRVRAPLVVAGLVIIAVGTLGRLTIAIHPLPACSPSGSTPAVTRQAPVGASVLAEKAATWPETGIGLLYAEADGARVCSSTSADFYVGVPAAIIGTKATNFGDIVLSPGYDNNQEKRAAVASHEAQHRPQWGSQPSLEVRWRSPSLTPSTTSSSPALGTTSSAWPAWNQVDTVMRAEAPC
jgi:hypothetical protein